VCLVAFSILVAGSQAFAASTWSGTLRDSAGSPLKAAIVTLRPVGNGPALQATTTPAGAFTFSRLAAGQYELSATWEGKTWTAPKPITVKDGVAVVTVLGLPSPPSLELQILVLQQTAAAQASGGQHLSSGEVSSLPLNERDFSKLLLLAAGTMTDTNGAANFTQQFAVNGQRGTATVFAIDGADTTDPELGGATFSNFNVDAIQEVQSSSGVMPAEIGHGAAGYTNVITKSGTEQIHGGAFEFLRNAAFDARNFFDRRSVADEGRIPPFIRNEFGFAVGGPLVLPHLYNGSKRTFWFGEYQGFRQVLGTTQVYPVPTLADRSGIDTTSVPGDTLIVPVNPKVVPVLAAYPLPNDPLGPDGALTYATESPVGTRTDQVSLRIDHHISDKASLLGRFSLNQVNGPINNPDQTSINPTYGVNFFDHQRNALLRYTRTLSSNVTSESSISYIRSTPIFAAQNHTQPAIGFGDGLFEGLETAAGQLLGSYGNVFQGKQDFSYTHGPHAFKWGTEMRFNFDATVFAVNPNGQYVFGGGTAYSPVFIPSASGQHNIPAGAPLPDSLTGLLTATPYSYTVDVASDLAGQGNKFDEAAARRQAYNFYFQDTWKVTRHLSVSYGLRYEVDSRIHEAKHRTSGPEILGPDGQPAPFWVVGAQQVFLLNPQPPYQKDWNGWGPRLALDYGLSGHTVLHAGGAITTLLTNLWQDNFLTGSIPFAYTLFSSALQGVTVPFQNSVVPVTLPAPYTPQGQLVVPTGVTTAVPPNTPIDLERLENDLAALTPGHQLQLLSVTGMARDFRNGYVGSWTAGVDHDFRSVKVSAAYVGTAGVHLGSAVFPNSYNGAEPGFAPFTEFNSAGQPTGGIGLEALMASGSHSTYHALQTSVSKNSVSAGLGFQASYTYSKSLDDTSSVLGGFFPSAGTVLQTFPQNPWDPGAEKGPSTFDTTNVFTLSAIEALPLDRMSLLRPLGRPLTRGWQLLNITTVTSGSPFTVFSGIQQTGDGSVGSDRPDLVSHPVLSTSRGVREDYFGLGANNASFFNIPIDVPGGTGPNQGIHGTLGRDTFRGPGYQDYDVAVIKDTPVGHRGNGELGDLQFRAEFFNVFNLVNFGLPNNIVRGSGFGVISKTAGTSRQIQFSLKLIY
jgi:Carboxypeptidase regulatory-like domain